MLVQSVAADHINRSCSCRPRSIDHQRVRRYAPFHSIETCARMALRDSFFKLMFFAYKKMLGQIETRTRDRIYCQTMQTVRDISRDDRARIATRSLRMLTDRQTDRLKVVLAWCKVKTPCHANGVFINKC